MIRISFLFIFLSWLIPFSAIKAQDEEWHNECKSSRIVDNFKFTFPSEVTRELREYYVKKQIYLVKFLLQLIQ